MGARSLISIDLKTMLTRKVSIQLLMFGLCFSLLTACNFFAGSEEKKGKQDQVSTDNNNQSEDPKADQSKEQSEPSIPKGAVASVNGSLISQKDFDLLFEERAKQTSQWKQ